MSLTPPSTESQTVSAAAAPAAHFRYTFEEFCEAALAIERRRERIEREGSTRPVIPAAVPGRGAHLGWWRRIVILLPLAALYAAFVPGRRGLPAGLAPRPGEHFLLRVFAPIALYVLVMWVIQLLARRAQFAGARALRPSPDERRARAVAWVSVAVMITLVLVMTVGDARTFDRDGGLLHDLVLLAVPWVAIGTMGYLRHVDPWRHVGGQLRWSWATNPSVHLEKTIVVDETAVHLSDARTRHELRWDGLAGIEETDNLFTLVSGTVFYILPKRVLTPEQTVLVRNVLAPPRPTFTGGFPVLPARPEGVRGT